MGKKQAEKRPKWKVEVAKFLDWYPVVILMTVITVYALFFDDIRIILFTPTEDDIFFGISLVGFILFSIEIILASITKEDYFISFFFWLDLVSTLSMIPDIGWIWNPLVGGGSAGGADSATDLAKTSRASKVTRVVRVIRLIRLIRIVKLYKQAKLAQKKNLERKSGGLMRKKPVGASVMGASGASEKDSGKNHHQKIHPLGGESEEKK